MDRIDGLATLGDGTPVLKARVRAIPEKGKANDAILKLLARIAGIPASRARLLSGDAARRKSILLEGDGAALARDFAKLFAAKG
jgi:uncharacterized protein YggU (UPF0235/DUF167 family)